MLCAYSLSRIRLFVTPWTVAHQAPLSMGFFRREYWNGLPFPPLGKYVAISPLRDLPDPGIESASPVSLSLQADSLPPEPPRKPPSITNTTGFPFIAIVYLETKISQNLGPQQTLSAT